MIQFRHMKLARWALTFMTALLLADLIYALATVSRHVPLSPSALSTHADALFAYLALLALPACLGIGLAIAAMCTWVESWTLTNQALTYFGLFRTRKIELAAVEKLLWWPFNRMIVVYGSGTRIPIFIESLPRPLRARLIAQLRQAIPEECQKGWARFDRRAYQPLLKKLELQQKSAEQSPNRQAEQYSNDA